MASGRGGLLTVLCYKCILNTKWLNLNVLFIGRGRNW